MTMSSDDRVGFAPGMDGREGLEALQARLDALEAKQAQLREAMWTHNARLGELIGRVRDLVAELERKGSAS
jgi:hypothetical protein